MFLTSLVVSTVLSLRNVRRLAVYVMTESRRHCAESPDMSDVSHICLTNSWEGYGHVITTRARRIPRISFVIKPTVNDAYCP